MLSSQSIAATPVVPSTLFSVAYPATFDSDKCDQLAFSGTISSLALPKIPLTSVYSHIENDPVVHRDSLIVELLQRTFIGASIRIEGEPATLKDIEGKLSNGIEVKLTEYKRCAEADKSLQLVELVNFTPALKNLAPDLGAKIEFIKKNEHGECAAVSSKSLGELVKMYNPGVNLNNIEADVDVHASGISADDHKSIGKEISISFKTKDGMNEVLSRPIINIRLPADLSYTVIDKLKRPDGLLRMTGGPDACKGQRSDDPVWIYNMKIS